MIIHSSHTPTPRNDMPALQKLMDNIKRGGPETSEKPSHGATKP